MEGAEDGDAAIYRGALLEDGGGFGGGLGGEDVGTQVCDCACICACACL